jgi:FkbH-like protein
MKLLEALELTRKVLPNAAPLRVALATGFTPLHLETFLAAHLQTHFPTRRIEVSTGLYGDLPGNLNRIERDTEAVAVVIEWPDLDPRLGVRRLGGWGPPQIEDILEECRRQAMVIRAALEHASQFAPVAVCLPTLPFPPVFFTAGWQASAAELQLRETAAGLASWAAKTPHLRVVSPQYLDRHSPALRFDVKSECSLGFPYTMPHADTIGAALAALIRNAPPMKGLITDLDGTLWKGILGEVGVDGVTWTLEHGSQVHGLYQQVLSSLAQTGVLVAVASKNDPDLVQKAFAREDLLVRQQDLFPIEVHWSRKSESITRILEAWNVAADSVVFIDDSPLELAEVKSQHPDVECIFFPSESHSGVYELLEQLRCRFGKDRLAQEDTIRSASLRTAQVFHESIDGPDPEDFLAGLRAELDFNFNKNPPDPRALELVNKTNQFNLNGTRYTDADWNAILKPQDAFLMLVSYTDRFGPLGKIATLAGRHVGNTVFLNTWVMSCRAFSRRIEQKCLEQLFDTFNAQEVVFDFLPTERNKVLKQFFESILDQPPQPGQRLSRDAFRAKCPPLFHQLVTHA